jgi:uncharacterized membrane protein YhaH (DUF805 family)
MGVDFKDITKDLNFDLIKDTYIGVLKKYFVIQGRARRREFWIFCLINVILGLIPVIGWIIDLATFIPSFTVMVRRLHDIDKSGKYILLGFVPLVGLLFMIIGLFAGGGGMIGFFSIIILLASIGVAVLLLVWAAKEGTHGKNDYGPDPKAGSKSRK